VGGAVVGGIVGTKSGNQRTGVVAGALAGAALGAGVGYYLDRRAAQRLEQIQGVEQVQTNTVAGGSAASEPAIGAIKFNMKSDMLFNQGSATVSPAGAQTLNEVAAVLADYPDTQVMVRGFASAEGNEQFNIQLSGQRADMVRNHLIGRNIPASRITAVGMGIDTSGDNTTEAGRAMSRRVEIEVLPRAARP
jgi:outer membrane protein OmpA-like peptidoglycan-associated protein